MTIPAVRTRRGENRRILLLGSHLNYNLEHFAKIALERAGCIVQFRGYENLMDSVNMAVRIAITRSKGVRRVIQSVLLRPYDDEVRRTARAFAPSLVLVIKGEGIAPDTIRFLSGEIGSRTAIWTPDDPRYFHSLSKWVAPYYDIIFTPSMRFKEKYLESGAPKVEVLPFACEPTIHNFSKLPYDQHRALSCDICFVGMYTLRRARIVSALQNQGFKVNVYGPYWKYFSRATNAKGPVLGHEMSRVYSAARIVLNIHDENDLGFKPNMRVFESTGCRSLSMSDKAADIDQYFAIGNEIICYDDVEHLCNLALEYLQNPRARDDIASKGQARAYRDHTYDHRIATLLDTI